MKELDFLFIGWCKETKNNVVSDKVWTAFTVGRTAYAGWGRRGKAIRFKKHESVHSLRKLIRKKRQSYNEVDAFQLFSIFPHFKDDVEKYLSFSIIANKVM